MAMSLLAFTWFTRDCGLVCFGLVACALVLWAVHNYDKAAYVAVGIAVGAASLYLAATLLRWRF